MSEYVVGVDGCTDGWFAVWMPEAGVLNSDRYDSFETIIHDHTAANQILVDIPIGLPETDPRECDTVARERLGARGRSVFPVPCQEVVEHARKDNASYDRANALQDEHLDSGLSKQAWNITSKIAEVNGYLREDSPSVEIAESHPECCFAALNDWYPIAQPKSTEAGRGARFGILDSELDGWRACYEAALDNHYRKDVARDDIIDALALVAAGQHATKPLPDDPPTDAADLPMQIVIPDIEPSWHEHLSIAEQ